MNATKLKSIGFAKMQRLASWALQWVLSGKEMMWQEMQSIQGCIITVSTYLIFCAWQIGLRKPEKIPWNPQQLTAWEPLVAEFVVRSGTKQVDSIRKKKLKANQITNFWVTLPGSIFPFLKLIYHWNYTYIRPILNFWGWGASGSRFSFWLWRFLLANIATVAHNKF